MVLRGDIYYGDLGKRSGSVQSGIRPLLVIQNDVGNAHSPTYIVAPLTSNVKKGYLPTHVLIDKSLSKLQEDSFVLFEQITTIDKKNLKEYVSHIDDEHLAKIDKAICVSLGLKYIKFDSEIIVHNS